MDRACGSLAGRCKTVLVWACSFVDNAYLYAFLSPQDIARLLQERELQEEKRRKKHIPEFSGGNDYGDSFYYEDGGKMLHHNLLYSYT